MNELIETKVWVGRYKDVGFKIRHWGVGKECTPCNGGTWNYYVFLQEYQTNDFAKWWLEDKIMTALGSERRYIDHDYFDLPIEMHYGPTFYRKHGHAPGHRYVEIGCDYNHLWDMERGYAPCLEEVLNDAHATIDKLIADGHIKSAPVQVSS